jgi:D-glycero-alpha-D-manno-heptose 1-phosphate guanylyltransferase
MAGLAEITAVILAGGRGSRLKPVLPHQPKVMAEFHGRPFLAYLLDQLVAAGVPKVVLCTGYRGVEIRTQLGHAYGSAPLTYSHEDEPLGTGGALRLAVPLLDSDPVLVMNGDSLIEADFKDYLAWFLGRPAAAALTLARVEDTARFGRVEVAGDDSITSFQEKGVPGPGWINAGVYLLKKAVLELIPPRRFFSLEGDLLPTLVGQGLYGHKVAGRFIDIGTPESYAVAADFLRRLREETKIHF